MRAGIVGASGYTGVELLRLLAGHPELEVVTVTAASLLFVRWSPAGDRPVGHVESDVLARGRTPEEAKERIGSLSLFDVKAALDEAIARAPGEW